MSNDNVNHPEHYTQGVIECIDAMLSAFGGDAVQEYCVCNAFKYLWRHKHKGKRAEDVSKAQWYLAKWQEIEKKGTNQ